MKKSSTPAYELVADLIIKQLENGTVPWRKPWTLPAGVYPQNVEGKSYRGINAILLGMTPFEDPRWVTFKKAKELGGHVSKGEKGMPIVFWKWLEVKDDNAMEADATKNIPMLKRYTVFNVSQCEGLSVPPLDTKVSTPDWNVIEEAESIVSGMPNAPIISEDGGTQAFYIPSKDGIHMPPKPAFDDAGEWYSTLFHEMTHSTGHAKRLDRSTVTATARFGSPTYSREELVAEFGAAYLCHTSGIENTIDNSAAYIDGWLKKLCNDKKLAIVAAAQGQKAADYILNLD